MDKLLNLISKNKGKFIGCIIGIIFGILVLKIGLLKTIFILICISLGIYLGNRFDRGNDNDFWDKIR
ncbi:MAG: DUF2273 domain-containing protein [Clostridia bacterium]|nr:DUF2273 domain-containing protein [Clostridia bacterium]